MQRRHPVRWKQYEITLALDNMKSQLHLCHGLIHEAAELLVINQAAPAAAALSAGES